MKIKVNNLNKYILLIYIVIAILFSSGSVFGKDVTTLVEKSNCILLVVLYYQYYKRQGIENLFRIKISAIDLLLTVMVLTSLIDVILWNEYSMVYYYISQVAIFFDAYLIVKLVHYSDFKKVFINTIMFISIISVFGWIFTKQLINFAPIRINKTWDYRFFYVFTINANDMTRNYGIFREPGVYAGFVVLAMLLILEDKRSIKNNIFLLILAFTVFTTGSTTGYFLLILLLIYYISNRFKGKISIFVSGLLCIFSVYLFFIQDIIIKFINYINPSVLFKIETENASYTTRLYSMQYDMIIALHNPFGIGPHYLPEAVSNLVNSFGHVVDARTSAITTAFVMYGLLYGCIYTYIILRGCLFRGHSIFKNILVTTIVLIVINTEPHFSFLATECLIFYWYSISKSHIVRSYVSM